MEPVAAKRRGVTPAQMLDAERSFERMLARKFSAVWIAENAKDVLAQAHIEYMEWLEENPPAKSPVGWLLTCAYRRALNLFDAQRRKPSMASLESVFHLADGSTPTPEEQALDNDRQKRLREALSHLPDKECKLLALVYFEGMSIREAGRKIGWQKSAADRHHDWAMEKMLSLVGDRSLLSPASLGVAAWVVAKGEGHRPWAAPLEATADFAREGVAIGVEATTTGAHRLGELVRRLAPFSEPSNTAALSGVGRAAGYCAAAAGVAVCGLAATGVVGPGMTAVEADRPEPTRPRSAEPAQQASAPAPVVRHVPSAVPRRSQSTGSAEVPKASEGTSETRKPNPQSEFAPQATGSDTVTEFGVDRGSGEGSEPAPEPEASGGESSSSTPPPAPSPAPKSPDSAPSAEFGL
ncbi:MAG: sigma-70 family RNA polymerase sigma factor [Solirubrobacterales bacterium]